jgi:hypothetical protein
MPPDENSKQGFYTHIKKNLEERIWVGRIVIYVIALIEFFSTVITQFIKPNDFLFYNLIIAAAIAGIFIVFGMWAKEKPFAAFLTTLIIYLAAIVVDISYNGINIFHGIILRSTIFIFLIRGIDATRQLQQLNENEAELNKANQK